MDPNANLKEQLELATKMLAPDYDEGARRSQDDAIRLAELVIALHEWLGNGGFKPQAWGN